MSAQLPENDVIVVSPVEEAVWEQQEDDDLPDLICMTCGDVVGFDDYCRCMEDDD